MASEANVPIAAEMPERRISGTPMTKAKTVESVPAINAAGIVGNCRAVRKGGRSRTIFFMLGGMVSKAEP